MSKTVHTYEKDGVTVLWRPELCIHSGVCVRGLGQVFNPTLRPWINMDEAPAARIADQVNRCPSGALSLAGSETGD